jgi:hypothetical protein
MIARALHRALVVGITAVLTACASSGSFSECPEAMNGARREMRTFLHPNGKVLARGLGLAKSWDEPLPRSVAATRLGRWEYFYEDGSKRAEVRYALACYIECCFAGPCPQLHDYPIGAFKLWYPSGRLLGEGTFVTVTRHVDTSCEGGDYTKDARISSESRFWREDRSPMTLADARAAGLLLADW